MPQRIETAPSPFDLFAQKVASPAKESPVEAETPVEMVKPTLNRNPIRHLLAVKEQVLSTAEGMMESNIDKIEEFRVDLEKLRAEQIAKLRESLSSEDSSGFWGFLAKIGSMLMAAISTVFGVFLVTTGAGTLVGGAMVAAGLLSIANIALEETGAWDWIALKISNENEEFRQVFRTFVPVAIGIVCSLAGLGGVGITWGVLDIGGQALAVAQVAMNLTVAVTTGAKGIHLAQMSWAQSEQVELKAKVFEKQEQLEELSNRIIAGQRHVSQELKNAARIINN